MSSAPSSGFCWRKRQDPLGTQPGSLCRSWTSTASPPVGPSGTPVVPCPPPVLVPGLPLELGVGLPKVPLYLSLSSLPPPWLKLEPQPLRGPPSPSDRPFARPTSSLASSLPLHVHHLWSCSSESTPGCPLQLLHCSALCSECFPSGFPHGSRLSFSSGGPP